jgi:hypothetical protein
MKISKRILIISILFIFVILIGLSYGFFLLGKSIGFETGKKVSNAKGYAESSEIGKTEGQEILLKTSENVSLSAQDRIYWMEGQNQYINGKEVTYETQFTTNDLTRAQEHVPFTIVIPTYLPSTNQRLPDISGPLITSGGKRIWIRVTYSVLPKGIIVITEGKYAPGSTIPEVEGREYVDIGGTQVLKDKNNTVFNFRSSDYGFALSAYDVPGEETLKVVESMIKQIK